MTDETLATKTTTHTGFKTPHYYRHISGVECLEISKHLSSPLGQAFQYVWRCDNKHDSPIDDLKKALHWLHVEKSIDDHDYHRIPRELGNRIVKLVYAVKEKEPDSEKFKLFHYIGLANIMSENGRIHYLDMAIKLLTAMIERLETR